MHVYMGICEFGMDTRNLYNCVCRHIRLEQLRKLSVREDSCTLCFDKRASVRLIPCGHKGFCSSCALQLAECPMCRASIQEFASEDT